MSSQTIQSVRGMRDILPPESDQRQQLIALIHRILGQFGYHNIDLPLLEKTGLFQRAVGDETDIVSKEMYTFLDRNEESLTLRPEGTAGVVRAMIQNGLLQQTQRFYVEGPMFRYERPQKGRYRQFSQISVESFGLAGPEQDVELIQIGQALFTALGIRDLVTLEINTIGLPAERAAFHQDLVAYLEQHLDALDEDSKRRLHTNPLRILDSKDVEVQRCLDDAPQLHDYLGEESAEHFAAVKRYLDALHIDYVVNPRLVRGLDYYCHSVIEWTTTALGAQGTVTAGGRYDGLVEQLGGKATPAAGFAFGLDRILLLAQTRNVFSEKRPDIYVLAASEAQQTTAMQWANRLREELPSWQIIMHNEFQALKNQFKKADKVHARYALVFGEQEVSAHTATLKNLGDGTQQTLDYDGLIAALNHEDNQ